MIDLLRKISGAPGVLVVQKLAGSLQTKARGHEDPQIQ